MLYLIYKIGLLILRFVTTKTAYSIASFFAKAKYIFSKGDRKIVKANLRTVIPSASAKEISLAAENVFANFAKYLVDFFSLAKNQKNYLKEMVQFVGIENIDEALKFGKGCIITSAHFGNWELAGCAVANLGYKLNVIALEHRDPRINNLFIQQRRQSGVNVLPIGTAKTAYQKALSKGEIIAILGDRPYSEQGIEIEFFGKKAVFPRGAALFSLKYGSPIVMCFSYKEDLKTNKYSIVFDKPFLVKRESCLDAQLRDITQRFADRFQYYIRKYPSQWYMFNKVWE